ncbi:type I restriction-modification system [Anopheles sinensis]|uniref:Type I restriction-modification system n=1 Tax=Anopheles sinensis TaxID=74873 RepID=A0A084VPH3_ANOSI|nr:type I restriction-modification system [Anopheles sinensis]
MALARRPKSDLASGEVSIAAGRTEPFVRPGEDVDESVSLPSVFGSRMAFVP